MPGSLTLPEIVERHKDVIGSEGMYLHGDPRPGLVRLAAQGLRYGTGYEHETAKQRRACARELERWLERAGQMSLDEVAS